MARQALLLINRIGLLFLSTVLLVSCYHASSTLEKNPVFVSINYTQEGFSKERQLLLFQKKPFTGILFGLYDTNDTVFTTTYVEGKEHGCSKKWYPNNIMTEIRHYEKGRKTGKHSGWWENGQLKFVCHYSNDLFDGNVKEWAETGNLYKDSNYKNGHETGTQKLWRPDGTLYANYVVKNGRNYGLTGVKNCKNVGDVITKN